MISPSSCFWVNKLRMLSVVDWPPGFPATYCLDLITEMHIIVCTVVLKARRSCCNSLILIQLFLLCQHVKVTSLIMTSQAHSLLLAVYSLSLAQTTDQPWPQRDLISSER